MLRKQLYTPAFLSHNLLMPMDVPPAIEADAPGDGMDYALEGVVLTGASDDLDRAQNAAESLQWGIKRDSGKLEVRIPAQTTMGEFADYMRRVMDREFGDVKLAIMTRSPYPPHQ